MADPKSAVPKGRRNIRPFVICGASDAEKVSKAIPKDYDIVVVPDDKVDEVIELTKKALQSKFGSTEMLSVVKVS
jgi:nitrogen regulatory protein PII